MELYTLACGILIEIANKEEEFSSGPMDLSMRDSGWKVELTEEADSS